MDLVTFAESLIKGIVSDPDMIKVKQFSSDENSIILEIIVQEKDMGVVIGKNGNMAKSIRTIIQAYAYLHKMNKVKVNIDSF